MHLHLSDLRNGYKDVCDAVLAEGELSAPRGLATKEVIGAILTVDDPTDVLPVGVGRKVALGLAAEEAAQVIAGVSDFPRLQAVAPNMVNFADFNRFHGAYGPRVIPQLWPAVRRLVHDPESRRAVINVWDPVQDLLTDGVKNYPCTTQLQFFLRDGKLTLYTTMRANDVWHGLAYDAFVFCQLQLSVANALGCGVGPYVHHATSLHLYEEHWEAAGALEYTDKKGPFVCGVGHHFMAGAFEDLLEARVRQLSFRAQELLAGEATALTPSEEWYAQRLATS